MSALLGEGSNYMRKNLRLTRWGIFLVLLHLALASTAYADQLCTDCHGANGPHMPQCGSTTTCGVSCHQGKLDAIMHPAGANTPISDGTTTTGISTACKTCHQLPFTTHPFRINTVPGMISMYPNLDQVCGQCHGGGTESAGSPPRPGVDYLTTNQLAVVAPNIHSGSTTSWLNSMDCILCHNGSPFPPTFVGHPTGTGTPGTGAAACRSCHLANSILHQKAAVSVDKVCGQCHGGSRGAGAAVSPAPYFTEAMVSESSKMLHDSNKASTVNCDVCHSTANPVAETLSNMGHPQAPGTPSCIQCHDAPLHTASAPVAGTIILNACSTCHGSGGSAHKFTGLRNDPLTAFASGIHIKNDPGATCTNCHTESLTSTRHPIGATTPSCATCHISAQGARAGVIPTTAQACDQCHGGSSGTTTHNGAPYLTAAQLTTFRANIHGTLPTASFAWQTDASKDYTILLDASSSTCTPGATCTYSWSTGETGMTASHTFPNSTTTTVTLTVTTSTGFSSSTSKSVTPKYVAEHPTVFSAPLTVTPGGYTPTLNWSISGGVAPYTVLINWGDGTTTSATQPAAGPGSLSHTYVTAKQYTVNVIATDSGVSGSNVTSASASTTLVIAPISATVSGKVTRSNGTTPISSVAMTLKQGAVVKKLAYTDASGNYTMTGVAAGTYTLTATRSGYTFPAPVVVDTNTGNQTVNIRSITP